MNVLSPIPDRRPERPVTAGVICDFIALALGWLVFNIIRFYTLPLSYVANLTDWLLQRPVVLGQIIVPSAMIGLYAFTGCYARRRSVPTSRLDMTLNTIGVSVIGMLGIFFTALINDNVPERLANYELMGILLLCLAVPVLIIRLVRFDIERRKSQHLLRKALIVYPDNETHIRRIIACAVDKGFRVVAIHNTSGTMKKTSKTVCGLPVVRGELEDICLEMDIDALMMPVSDSQKLRDKSVTDPLFRLERPLFIAPYGRELLNTLQRMNAVRPDPLVDIASPQISELTANLKRLFDIVGSTLALIVLSPVLLAIAVAVKRDSKGPVFYRQERLGRWRKPFKIIKFRTMRTDAEANGPLLSYDNDPRITRLGRWLRKYRLDELPQFWNVLIGEMSLVGPRPERGFFAEQILSREPSYMVIQQVRPGITSWGMVKFGYATDVDQMVERMAYDMLYLRNVSMAIDMKIMLHTVSTVVTGRGM